MAGAKACFKKKAHKPRGNMKSDFSKKSVEYARGRGVFDIVQIGFLSVIVSVNDAPHYCVMEGLLLSF